MGYLLFNELNNNHSTSNGSNNKTNEKVMERLKILQTAFEQIKSYQHNTYFHEMINNFEFDLDEDEIKELNKLHEDQQQTKNNTSGSNGFNTISTNQSSDDDTNQSPSPPQREYIHPFGFGMWLQEQTYIDLDYRNYGRQ